MDPLKKTFSVLVAGFSVYFLGSKMPPKKVVAKVSTMSVTAEEVAAAKKILNSLDDKAKASNMASMVHLCKNSGDDKVLESRGACRQAYLEKFIAFQQKNDRARKSTEVIKESNHVKEKEGLKTWMGKETMDLKLGPERAEYLRQKGVFKKRPCPYTGSTDDIHSEWHVDKNMEREVEQDTKGMKITAVTETEADDYANLASASAFEPARLLRPTCW